MQKTNNGFTLVELAIVLVIIGLLVGGVLQGQELIKQAEIRKHIQVYKDIELGWSQFKVKYNAIPGDILQPERFFPECTNSVLGDGMSLIRGNGNGMLENLSASYEPLCAMLHLKNSGLYEPMIVKQYGIDGSAPPQDIDYSVDAYETFLWPANVMGQAMVYNPYIFDSFHHEKRDRHFVFVSGLSSKSYISGEDLGEIDGKMDDGKPARGRVQAGDPNGLGCYDEYDDNSTSPTEDSVYLSDDTISCYIYYFLD